MSFSAPATNGSAITSYTVTATDATTPANGGQSVSGSSSPIVVSGLTNGDSYSFEVTATNAIGPGTSSEVSNSVIPAGLPGIPTEVTATATDLSAAISWKAPGANGSKILSYLVIGTDTFNLLNTTPITCSTVLLASSGPPPGSLLDSPSK